MDSVRTIIVGAGVTGLATAAALSERGDDDYVVLEADSEMGGFCKTVKKDGFVWDYSGHFFHFKHPEIERWLRDRMPGERVRVVEKKSFVAYGGGFVDFPFQKNIHQLPKDDFIDCLARQIFSLFSYHLQWRNSIPDNKKPQSVLSFRDNHPQIFCHNRRIKKIFSD